MKKLERYVFGSFLATFTLAFLVLSFVFTLVPMVQIARYIMQGVRIELVWDFVCVSFPETIQWTVPLALMFSSILVFSRLSTDSEIAAMRACGVNLLSVMRWPLTFAFLCTLMCLFVNNEVVPRGHEVRRQLTRSLSVDTGLDVLEPGRVSVLPGRSRTQLYFRARDKTDGSLLDVEIDDVEVDDNRNPTCILSIEAKRASLHQAGRDILLDAQDIEIRPVGLEPSLLRRAERRRHGGEKANLPDIELNQPLQMGTLNNCIVPADLKDGEYKRKEKDFRFFEILREIDARKQAVKEAPKTKTKLVEQSADAEQPKVTRLAWFLNRDKGHTEKKKKDKKYSPRQAARRALSDIRTEFMKRWVFAFASICFVLVGMPLGIRSTRKESFIGMGVALVTILAYYLIILLMLNQSKNYHIHPEVLIWLPVGLCVLLSALLIPKNL